MMGLDLMKTKTRKITLGTREWADSNVNCYFGCSNDCRYCYAKKMAIRFNKKTKDTWKIMVPNIKNIKKGYRKRNGRIMFPTSHDITDESLSNCLTLLKKLFNSGNEILVTTKPRSKCIKVICKNFLENKELVQFRFTITSKNSNLLKFWEPGAPSFEERYESLKYAFHQGFKTSISIEPFLDKDPFELVEILMPFATESIWIGKMNYISKKNFKTHELGYYKYIKLLNEKENLIKIIKKAKKYDSSFLRIKDSIFNALSFQDLTKIK